MAAGVARPIGCCRRARPRLKPARRRDRIPRAPRRGPRRSPRLTGWRRAPAPRAVPRRGARGDGPAAILRRAPELCLIESWRIPMPRASSTQALAGHRRRARGASTCSRPSTSSTSRASTAGRRADRVRVRETVPDAIVGDRRRRRPDRRHARIAGRAATRRQGLPRRARPGRAEQLLKIENLSALREVSLRQVAQEIEAERLPTMSRTEPRGAAARQRRPAGDRRRLLALITPQPRSQRIVRRAWRSAQRLGAELDVLWVADHEPGEAEHEQLDALRRLASVLGAHLFIERGDNVAAVARRGSRRRSEHDLCADRDAQDRAAPLRGLVRPALAFQLLSLHLDLGSSLTTRDAGGTVDPRLRHGPSRLAPGPRRRCPGLHLRDRIRRPARSPVPRTRRILFPFVANALSTARARCRAAARAR